ncbi:MIB1 [Branchiostoma lanceolatum]|uniref:MIB1 protein n=1 Tax=Branchiostoma lanceolatum TaxID=7740 RepID=A0A8S4MPU1_BRALA|nr:MIB1 [Branchiostoma lanceolatum]
MEIHGRALGVQIVGEETVFVARYQCFERYDRAKIRTELDVSKKIMAAEGIRNVEGRSQKEMWHEFSTCGAEGLVHTVDDNGHVRLRLEKMTTDGMFGQEITGIDGVGFPKSMVSRMEVNDDIRFGDIVRVVHDPGLAKVSEDKILGLGHLIGSHVGQLGVVVKPMLFPESSFVVKIGQHNGVFKKSDLAVTEKRKFTEFQTSDSDKAERRSHGLAVGDYVKVNVSDEELRRLQSQHGGYLPGMQKCIGKVGRVTSLITVSEHDTITVSFSDGTQWCLNPKALERVNLGGKVFKKGDTVRFSDDVEKLKKLQEGHGGWNDSMNLVAGKTGTLKKVLIDNDLLISAMGTSFRWNPLAVKLSKDHEVPETVTDRHGITITVDDVVKVDPEELDSLQHYPKSYLDSMREERGSPGVIREIDRDGDLLVYYSNGKRLYLKTQIVSKESGVDASEIDTSAVIEVDDLVLIDSDCDKVKAVQTEIKIWHPQMSYVAGKIGRVRAMTPTGASLRVDVGGKTWSLAASLIIKANRSGMETERAITLKADAGAENLQVYASFARGDRVQIGVDPKTLKNLQEGHGGYSSEMEQSIGSNGSIMYIDDDGDTWANFPSYSAGFNTKALVKVPVPDEDGDRLFVGDFVKISQNKDEVKGRQQDHGGWNEDMEMVLGKTGRIDHMDGDGDIVVKAVGRKLLFHPKNLEQVSVQEDGQLSWNQADICAPGRHTWKTGKCMVCVKCERCTDYGDLSPHNSNPLKRPGSVCDCGGSDVGCVDCGKCRSCADESPDRGDPEVDLEIAAKIRSMKDKADHLHDIFKDVKASLTTDNTAEEQFGFGKGDVVRVKVTQEELEKLQTKEHGGYSPRKGQLVRL